MHYFRIQMGDTTYVWTPYSKQTKYMPWLLCWIYNIVRNVQVLGVLGNAIMLLQSEIRQSSLQPQNSITLFTPLILLCREISFHDLCTWISTCTAKITRCQISQSIQLPLTQDQQLSITLDWILSAFQKERRDKCW